MKVRILFGIAVLLLAAACSAAEPAEVPVDSAPVEQAAEPTSTPVELPTEAPAPSEEAAPPQEPEIQPTEEPPSPPEPVVREPQPALTWLYGCVLELKDYAEWCWLYDGAFTEIAVTNLPANAKTYPDVYDFSPSTNRVLMGLSDWAGAGPADMASTDLWLGTDPADLSLQPLVYESVVSEAVFSPDGSHIAYLAATESTYELHLLDPISGSDEVLAVDVAPEFSFSPDGRNIGFVRNAEWTLVGEGLGVYVLSLETRTETLVPLEAEGLIEVHSPLFWTPDSQTIVVPARYSTADGPVWQLVVVDLAGGTRANITVALETVGAYDSDLLNLNLVTPLVWAEDGSYFLANAVTGFMTADMTFWVLKYNLEPALGAITSIDVVAEQAEFIGWDVPEESVWVRPSVRSDAALPYSVQLP